MTDKRDLKRRVRDRQARTGEAYVTARQHVVAARPASVPVVTLRDLTAEAVRLGLRAAVVIDPELAARVDAPALVERLRDALVATPDDPATQLFRDVLLLGERPIGASRASLALVAEGRRLIARARAGIGGASDSGRMLSLAVARRDGGVEMVVALLWLAVIPTAGDRRPAVIIAPATTGFEGLLPWTGRR